MHYRFLATFNKDKATDSAEARRYVYRYLLDNGFCGEGRWSGGLADWFVIGGRWSGELSRHSWAKALYERMDAREQAKGVQVWGAFYGDPADQKKQRRLLREFTRLWRREAPKPYCKIPIDRDTYEEEGYEDDAMIVTQEIYDALLKEHEGTEDSEEHADLDYEVVSEDMIGKKWIVVVDYHN